MDPLHHYYGVLKGESANFLKLKRVSVEIPEGIEELWNEHRKGMKAFLREDFEDDETSPNLLELKVKIAKEMLKNCEFCERKCKVNRYESVGFCGVTSEARVSTAFPHMGEEPMLIPSGTIFFSGCNFRCVYCQNWDISQFPTAGEVWSPERIARWVEKARVINVNLVGGEPTPNLHVILEAFTLVKRNIPVIWNSNMYMSEKAMELLHGFIDLYLSDFKYGNDECALRLSNAPNYFEIVARNHLIASEQCSLLIRHLVLPNHIDCCSIPIMDWIAQNIKGKALVNIMSQYWPAYRAHEYPEISRRLTSDEYWRVVEYAETLGLDYLVQPI